MGRFRKTSNTPCCCCTFCICPARITRQYECVTGCWQPALTWWENWKQKHDSTPALTPLRYLPVLFDWISMRDWFRWITKCVLDICFLSFCVVEHSRLFLSSCRMGLPLDQLDRDDRTHICEKQGEGGESQSEVSTRTPPPVSKKRKSQKRYFSVCLYYRAISFAHITSALVGCCSKAEVCPAFHLLSFRWLWINLTNCKYGSGMWWLKHLNVRYPF